MTTFDCIPLHLSLEFSYQKQHDLQTYSSSSSCDAIGNLFNNFTAKKCINLYSVIWPLNWYFPFFLSLYFCTWTELPTTTTRPPTGATHCYWLTEWNECEANDGACGQPASQPGNTLNISYTTTNTSPPQAPIRGEQQITIKTSWAIHT